MSVTLNIQRFLEKKFLDLKILRKDFIRDSGIARSSISELMNGIPVSPSLGTILKIANYFNCSIDEILGTATGQLTVKHKRYIKINPEEMSYNTRQFILSALTAHHITAEQLASECNIGIDTISYFIKKDDAKKNLSIKTICTIANHFKVPIDMIIGRIK